MWVASGLLLLVALGFPIGLRRVSPRLACEVAAFESGWSVFDRAPLLKDGALDPWGRPWIPRPAPGAGPRVIPIPTRVLWSPGPDGIDDGGGGDDVAVTGGLPGWILAARVLLVTAAALPLSFLYTPSARTPRRDVWQRELGLIAVTAIPALAWCWMLALLVSVGTGLLDKRSSILVVSPLTGLTLGVSCLIGILSVAARLTRRREPD